jgi:hypothetical protein
MAAAPVNMLSPAGVTGAAVTLATHAARRVTRSPFRRESERHDNDRRHGRRWEFSLSSPEGHDHRCPDLSTPHASGDIPDDPVFSHSAAPSRLRGEE